MINFQIYDLFGVEIIDLAPALSKNGEVVRIDIFQLPTGVNSIRIKDRVKLLKILFFHFR